LETWTFQRPTTRQLTEAKETETETKTETETNIEIETEPEIKIWKRSQSNYEVLKKRRQWGRIGFFLYRPLQL